MHPNLSREHLNANIFDPFENKKDEIIVESKTVGNNHGVSPQHVDLRSMLINLLSQKPHGVTLRVCESSFGFDLQFSYHQKIFSCYILFLK